MADARRVMALEAEVRELEKRVEQLEETVRDLVAASGPPPARLTLQPEGAA